MRKEAEMIIVSQNRQCLVNCDNIVAIQVHNQYIQAHAVTKESFPIGLYDSERRANEVLDSLMKSRDIIFAMPET